MTKKDMIDKIYKVVADKTVSFWCQIKTNPVFNTNYKRSIMLFVSAWFSERSKDKEAWKKSSHLRMINKDWNNCQNVWSRQDADKMLDWCLVIWHPVMIWDILDWIEERHWLKFARVKTDNISIIKVYEYRKEKRKPIEDQSENCIKFFYELVSR